MGGLGLQQQQQQRRGNRVRRPSLKRSNSDRASIEGSPIVERMETMENQEGDGGHSVKFAVATSAGASASASDSVDCIAGTPQSNAAKRINRMSTPAPAACKTSFNSDGKSESKTCKTPKSALVLRLKWQDMHRFSNNSSDSRNSNGFTGDIIDDSPASRLTQAGDTQQERALDRDCIYIPVELSQSSSFHDLASSYHRNISSAGFAVPTAEEGGRLRGLEEKVLVVSADGASEGNEHDTGDHQVRLTGLSLASRWDDGTCYCNN